MELAMRAKRTGGSDVMQLRPVQRSDPSSCEVWLEQQAIGGNGLDVMQRQGGIPIALPGRLGLEVLALRWL